MGNAPESAAATALALGAALPEALLLGSGPSASSFSSSFTAAGELRLADASAGDAPLAAASPVVVTVRGDVPACVLAALAGTLDWVGLAPSPPRDAGNVLA